MHLRALDGLGLEGVDDGGVVASLVARTPRSRSLLRRVGGELRVFLFRIILESSSLTPTTTSTYQ